MKKFFEEPEIEVVRFNAKDLIITTSSGCIGDETTDETGGCAGGDICVENTCDTDDED